MASVPCGLRYMAIVIDALATVHADYRQTTGGVHAEKLSGMAGQRVGAEQPDM